MMFDVGIRIGKNEQGKDRYVFNRVPYEQLSVFVRRVQDRGGYVFSITRLISLYHKNPTGKAIEEISTDGHMPYDGGGVEEDSRI